MFDGTLRVNTWMSSMVNVLKFQTLFSLIKKKMLVVRAGTHKVLVNKTDRVDPDQTASSEAI